MSNSQSRMRSAVLAVLVPLARMMLSFGLNARHATDLMKVAFVEAARTELAGEGRSASISQLSRQTRLTRQVVSNIVNRQPDCENSEGLSGPIEASILAAWHALNSYIDDRGMPRPLPIGPGPGTFAELAESVGATEPHSQLLDRLWRAGCVKIDDNRQVRALRRDFLNAEDLPRVIAVGLAPLAETIVHNWNSPKSSSLCQRVADSKAIDPARIGQLRRISRSRVSRFIEEFDDVLSGAEFDGDEIDTHSDTSLTVGVGAYYFEVARFR